MHLNLFIGLDLPTVCKQNEFEIHLDILEISFKFNLTLSGWGGEEFKSLNDQIHSCHSGTSYSMMPKLSDFYFLSLKHVLTKFQG